MAPKMAEMVGLPVTVSTPIDLGRLIRELETIDEALLQLNLRSPGAEVKLPKTSQMMDKVVELNKLNLLHKTDREALLHFLQRVREEAPVMHISFSADPPASFMEKLVAWLRKEIDPLVLVRIGLEPSIGAGCVVRTVNRQFDFSLKENFKKKRLLLKEALAPPKTEAAKAPAATPEAATPQPQGAAS